MVLSRFPFSVGCRDDIHVELSRRPGSACHHPHRQRHTPLALAQREMLEAAADGARRRVERYAQSDGSVNVPERWGVTMVPHDIMGSVGGRSRPRDGGAESRLPRRSVWEGHLRQFSRAKIGGRAPRRMELFVKEFPPSFDWEHTGEGSEAFYWVGLGCPNNQASLARVRCSRFLSERGIWCAQLRFRSSKYHQEPVQRQQRTGHETGHACRLGRRREPQARRTIQHILEYPWCISHPLTVGNDALHTGVSPDTRTQIQGMGVSIVSQRAAIARQPTAGISLPTSGLTGRLAANGMGSGTAEYSGWNSSGNYTLRGVPAAFGQAAMRAGTWLTSVPFAGKSTTSSLPREPRTVRVWFRTTTETQAGSRLVWLSSGRIFPDRRARESFRNHHRVVPLVAESRRREAHSS